MESVSDTCRPQNLGTRMALITNSHDESVYANILPEHVCFLFCFFSLDAVEFSIMMQILCIFLHKFVNSKSVNNY